MKTFTRGCVAAGTRAYTLHSLRRAFATDAATVLPRHVIARAGGWQGLERLDNHYVRPREEVIARKLGNEPSDHYSVQRNDRASAAL